MGFFPRRSFRIDILTAFCSLLLITFLAVIFFNYRSTSRIVLMLCDDLMTQTTQTVINETIDFLTPPANLTKESARMAASGVLSLTDVNRLERFAIIAVNSYTHLAMFFIGDRAGNFLFAKPEPGFGAVTKIVNRSVRPPIITRRTWDQALQAIDAKPMAADSFDPRTRPWYKGAEATRGLFWTDLYIFYTSQQPGLTVSHAIVNPKGEVVGVIGCDIELVELSVFLQSLKIGQHGLAFIMNDQQELVAYPEPSRLLASYDDHDGLRPVRVDALDNPAVVAALRHYRETGQAKFTYEAGGERYLASLASFPASFGKPWRVMVVLPENDFIGEVKTHTRQVLFICLFFLVLSVVVAVFMARRISRPILQLARETEHIRKFQLEEPLNLQSRITEVMVLGEAINRMKVSLRSFMRFAPEQLVREVVLAGRELMLGGERRDVTLLFGDLRNFTQFAERTRPEDVVQILNAHFDAMVRIISDHNGYVVDFLGDSLFAVFGAPQPDPDHVWQAVKCAATMQLTRQKLNDELTEPHLPRLEMGLGLHSGSCVVGNMGSQVRIKYGVVGHAVNLAARIETFTVGGQVLISEASRRLVEDRVVVSGPYEAYGKGVEGVIQIWELRGLRHEPGFDLPPVVSGLIPLAQPVAVGLRLITGKQIAPELYPGFLLQLAETGASLQAAINLDDFASVQIQVADSTGATATLDGKVVGHDGSPKNYLIRFGPLGESAAAVVRKILPAQG